MNVQSFQQLSFRQRVSLLDKAIFVAQSEGANFTALLYQTDCFYVEAFKHKKYQYIYQVDGFDDQERLNPYLKQISQQGFASLLAFPWKEMIEAVEAKSSRNAPLSGQLV